ncbi:mechanosensitive ion channel family protein [Dyella soli]|uniref:mechanosensitive ion channel family protein n=1 Tax=Dyella soli TaxID=522319 RepID=UPI0013F48A09|nr:mechanosensitive ion channel domain-containing protein [Dyella soli]
MRRTRSTAWTSLGSVLCMLGLAMAVSFTATAAEHPAPASTAPSPLEQGTAGSSIVVWNRSIITLHAPFHGVEPAERAEAASERIDGVIDRLKPEDITVSWTESGEDRGAMVRAGNLVLFGVLPGDVESGDRAAVEQAGVQAVDTLRGVIRERAQARQPRLLLNGILLGALATVLLAALCWLLVRLNRFAQHKLIAVTDARLRLDIAGFDLRPLVWTVLRRSVALLRLLLMLFFGYLWLSYVLRQFPYSRPWGAQLGEYLIDIGLRMATGLVNQLPNLLTLLVIFLIARAIVRLVGAWFHAVSSGTVQVGWLEAPTAAVTRRLVSVMIWLFALVVAYPYIPGAGSDAFKGVSVFLGLMLSLGSAGIVNQVMSGLVVLYSRAVRAGDFVHVGDHEGTVLEMGTLSLKLVTRTREEVTVPNSVLSSTPLRNMTRQSQSTGLLLTTTVTIGYDSPWRQVVALLELAAARTPDLLAQPRPFVLQRSLADYYIEYQLNVGTLRPSVYIQTLSDLNRNIVDAFNEFGVQIMSPHFRRQPDEKVWVPPEQWYASPATVPADSAPRAATGPTTPSVTQPDGKPPV